MSETSARPSDTRGILSDDLSYVRIHYGVPAEIGRRVKVSGRAGIITAPRGQYIGVTFDDDKPWRVHNAHPTSEVEYLEMDTPRRLTRSQRRYRDYLEVADLYEDFRHYLRAHP
jgi:hypothetical protein